MDTQELTQRVNMAGTWISDLRTEISRVIVGQRELVDH